MTSLEYAELQGRFVEQSYLIGNHGEGVSPFVFHSEREDKELLEQEEIKKVGFDFGKDWNMLLLDDCTGDKKMQDLNKNCSNINKEEIIRKDLERIDVSGNITIESVNNIKNAFSKLYDEKKQYSIILLDYLLDFNESKQREYGYHLLEIIDILSKLLEQLNTSENSDHSPIIDKTLEEQEKMYPYIFNIYKYIAKDTDTDGNPLLIVCDERILYNDVKKKLTNNLFGPNDQLYFMFTSPYWAAIYERLHEEQISLNNKYYQISIGACPTNTPYLFLYNLHDMMRMRYESLSITDEGEARPMCLVEFLEELFCNISNVQTRCVKKFDDLLRLRTLYNRIKDDNDRLIKSIFLDKEEYRNHFWEHLQNLIYLIAFGDIRQVPEMKEEYTFISDRLKKAEGKVYGENPKDHKGPSVLISDYITTLSKL